LFVALYYKLLGVDDKILNKLLSNDIEKTLGINFTLIFMFICLERYFYSKYNYKWMSNVIDEKEIVQSILDNTSK
jgi:hypothetical protein